MISFRFRKAYNVRQAAVSGAAAVALVALGIHQHQWIADIAGIAGLAVATRWASRALSDEPAIVVHQSGVDVAGMFGVSELAWSDIRAVTLQNRSPSNILGYYFGGTLGIGFQTQDSFISRTQLWLPTAAIDLPPGGASELLEILNHALIESRKGVIDSDLQPTVNRAAAEVS